MPALDVTTIPMPPQDFWGIVFGLGFILLTALAYIALTSVGKDYRPPKWEDYSPLTLALLMGLALIWLALFGLTIWAAIWGTYQMLHAPITETAASGGASAGLGGLGLGALLAALLGGPFLIWGTVIKQDTLAVSRQTLALSETALFNDKVNAALTGLYSRRQITRVVKDKKGLEQVLTEWEDDIVQRNGAIDRLEGLARERPSEVPRIANMLSVYVREVSNLSAPKRHPWQELSELVDPLGFEEGIDFDEALSRLGISADDIESSKLIEWAQGLKPFRTDAENAVQTLGRLRDIAGVDKDATKIDLRGANLQGFNLQGLNFDKAQMIGAHLEGADLYLARMENADLSRAWLNSVSLIEAQMKEADLSEARMDVASLWGAQLEGANLVEARMQGVVLWSARLQGANLARVRMQGADLTNAKMKGANLSWAQFDAATDWKDAEVRKAYAHDLDFANTAISKEQINSMFGDASVVLPKRMIPKRKYWPAHWPKEKLDTGDFNTAYNTWRSSQP